VNLAEIGNSLGPWLQLLSILGAVVQCVGTIVLWMLIRKFVTREDCAKCREACQGEVEKRLDKQEASAGELHDKVNQAPTKDALAVVDKADETLRGEIKALAATIQAQGEAMRGMARQLNLLMEHHLGRRQL
jgi:hypothetical protein